MPDRRFDNLVIFARRPALGVGKRRLAADVGDVEAWRFQRWAVAGLVRRLSGDPRWRVHLAVAPDRPAGWPGAGLSVWPQGRGDLGQRLMRLARRFPAGRLVIIGSDTPDIDRADIAAACEALRGRHAVVGPATDGGYWLIGLRRFPRGPAPFSGVRWSSPETLSDTLEALAGWRTARLRTLSDVDDGAALARWRAGQRP